MDSGMRRDGRGRGDSESRHQRDEGGLSVPVGAPTVADSAPATATPSWAWKAVRDGRLWETAARADAPEPPEALSSDAWCSAFVRSTAVAIIGTTPDGRISSWNPAAERLFGHAREDMLGSSIASLAPPDRQEEFARLRRALQNGLRVEAFDTVRVHKDGTHIPVQITLSPVCDEQGRVVGVSAVVRKQADCAAPEQPFEVVRADLESRIVASAAQLRAANAELKRQIHARERLAGRLLTLQDEERRRIGRELHDSTAQNLVALDMNLARLARSADVADADLTGTLADSRSLVAECLREIRTLSYLLHPPLLDESGLTSALRWYADGFTRRSGIAVNTEIDPGLGRLSREAEMALFRITQECLTNVHRHAGSPSVSIRLKRRPTAVILEVEDAGHGMTAEHMVDTGRSTLELGVGISGMRERLRRLGGQLIIASSVHGTSVRATLPLSGAGLIEQRRKAPEVVSNVG